MFFRYSNQKTQRDLPATLPHGDAGATFGAAGQHRRQGMTFNDTHTFGSGWLNEFRFGVNNIKFFMTPIDYGTNPAAAVGIGHQPERGDVGDDAADVSRTSGTWARTATSR